ncbi:MAG: TRAP transporter small permease subunit [Kiritimatiellaeota bacterium]|nr:TRAP transporter small permease subunit [Kiritimatiellota bacterium]
MSPPADTAVKAGLPRTDAAASTPLLPEEVVCAVLLAGMVLLMFSQAMVRNIGPLGRTAFATWLAHATEVLPSGLTWLTFLGCGAVTRRRALLRVELVRSVLSERSRDRLEILVWRLWAAFFAVLLVLGVAAVWIQRRQTTSLAWLPAWAVALSVPLGSALVLWRTTQNLRGLRRIAARPQCVQPGGERG